MNDESNNELSIKHDNSLLFAAIALAIVSVSLIVVSLCSLLRPHQVSQVNLTALKNVIQISQEWAYFQGQKEAMNGDVRIKYDTETKKYSWTKSCWDGGLQPTFDPSKSEDIGYFLTKTNLIK